MSTNTPKHKSSSGTFTLLALNQVGYSPKGGERWQLTMAEPHATTVLTFITAYGAVRYNDVLPEVADVGKLYQVRFHRTKRGNLIADAWSKVPVPEVSDEREPVRLTQG